MELTFTLILGLLIGSFLNVCIYRIPRGESISFPPSHCTNCDNKITAYDLIPVISYLFLGGRCRHCKTHISMRYPIIEFITCAIFGGLYLNFGLSFDLIKFAILACLMIVIGMIDHDTTDVYFSTTLTGFILGFIFLAVGVYLHFQVLTYIYGGLLGAGVITLIILLTKGMGWGDVEICGVCGLFLGFKLTVLMLFLSFVIGGVVGIILMATKKKSRKDYIPFGPYIAIAAIITMLVGNGIIEWYLSTLM